MEVYDFQQATADRIAAIFRAATVGPDGHEILSGGQRRVLLADEVGLGKTILAAEVIRRVREMRRAVADDMFRVVYVCSNLSIVRQNIANLGVREQLNLDESRLSMQHFVIATKTAALKENSGDEGAMPELLIPLTPATSFSRQGNAAGNVHERALIFAVLRLFEPLNECVDGLNTLLRRGVKEKNWTDAVKRYVDGISRLGDGYIVTMRDALLANADFTALLPRLREACSVSVGDDTCIINRLRRIFADISLSQLCPDLIIMDEFQRFSSLLDSSDPDCEQRAIVDKFFKPAQGQQPMILLLSATPYKPYTTLEELNETNLDSHYSDFNRLMEFLFGPGGEFREVWNDYSGKLSHLSGEEFDVVIAAKERAEEAMYGGMCRTERLNHGLLDTRNVAEVGVDKDDILSYCEMQRIVSACREAVPGFRWATMPVEYVKSAPYLLSFMDSYEFKKRIAAAYRVDSTPFEPSGRVLLSAADIRAFRRLPMRNARMQTLRDTMLGADASALMWVPASRPYYTTRADNPFARNTGFSKALVFSSWEMVPRMIAALLTYEAEREAMKTKGRKASYFGNSGSDRLQKDALKILLYASPYLASLYDYRSSFGRPVSEIRRDIIARLRERLRGIPVSDRRAYSRILATLRWLDGETDERPDLLSPGTVELLADMAIASPAVCLLRILGDKKVAEDCARGFRTLFNRRIAGYIIDRIQGSRNSSELYLEGVMDYCVLGNLQAVLDEYRAMCRDNDDFVTKLSSAFFDVTHVQVDTDESFGHPDTPRLPLRSYYAVAFGKGKKGVTEKTEQHASNIREAFNSPFYPFVLASTSVGQEGLDFHWYCRKIVHWNLPSNPQDLEQREGRINRYKCLAIRRNLSRLDTESKDWTEVFARAAARVRTEFGDRYTQMVPAWCLPEEWIDRYRNEIEWIERIVPQYPLSSDCDAYRRLKDILTLYRLTLGQPRQEDLVEMLASRNLTDEQIRSLLFNLSPVARRPRN